MRLVAALLLLLSLPGCDLCWYRGQAPGECPAGDDDDATGDDDDIAPDDDDAIDDDDATADDDDATPVDLCVGAPTELVLGPVTVPLMCLQPGVFFMGSPPDEDDRGVDEDRYRVILTKHVLMTAWEVPQALYLEVIGGTISDCTYGCGDLFPVQNITWVESIEFCNALSDDVGLPHAYPVVDSNDTEWDLDSTGWRLPTEAEWEYAARGGEDFVYSGSDTLADVAWCNGAEDPYDGTPVGSLQANAWGFFDMSGNVSEWVWDLYDDYPSVETEDPTGAVWASDRVARGGNFTSSEPSCRVADRTHSLVWSNYWTRGLRLARTLQ